MSDSLETLLRQFENQYFSDLETRAVEVYRVDGRLKPALQIVDISAAVDATERLRAD